MKYQPQAVFGGFSGSTGSTTAGRNGYSNYVHTKRQVNKAPTLKRQAVRLVMKFLTRVWKTLTPTQHTAWDDYGNTITRTNALGHTYHLSGNAAFKMINCVLMIRSLTLLEDPPITPEPQNFTTYALDVTPGDGPSAEMILTVSPATPTGASSIDIFAWPGQSTGLAKPKRHREQLLYSSLIIGGQTTYDLTLNYYGLFGRLSAGQNFWITLATITDQGVRTVPVQIKATLH